MDRWFYQHTDYLAKIEENERVNHLEKLRTVINELNNHTQLRNAAGNCRFENLFDCFNTSDEKQIKLLVAILNDLLSGCEPNEVFFLYAHFGHAIQHPNIEAKKFVLNQLKRCTKEVSIVHTISAHEKPLISSIIDCVNSDDLSLALIAIEVLSELGKNETDLPWYTDPNLFKQIEKISAENDTVRFRVYEIFANIGAHPHSVVQKLETCETNKVLTNLLNELQSNDILLQLASLEVIKKLTVCDDGLQFLKEKKVLEYIGNQLNDYSNVNPLLVSGFIKFFENMVQASPENFFQEYPNVINLVFQLYDANDLVLSNIALETIGYIASSSAGKLALKKYDSSMANAMRVIGKMIELEPNERKVIALNVLTNILCVENDQRREILPNTNRWFSFLCENPMKMLKNVCEKPFMELKLAGLNALRVIVAQRWGQEQIDKCPGLIEYLLDRNEESDLNCKTIKYEIVKTLRESNYWKCDTHPEMYKKLSSHVQQGVYYVQTTTEIAFESAT